MSIQTQLQVLEAFPISKLSVAKRATAPNGQAAADTGKQRASAAIDKAGGKTKDAERSGKKSKRKGDGDSERKSKKNRQSEAA